MGDTDMLSPVCALLGEPDRTRILTALLTGRALTAKELAYFAGVTAATASSHLSRLLGGNLLAMEKQGRCHYYRLRSADVARAIEGLMTVATIPSDGWPPHHRVDPALREARMCYDHMAGRLGVAVCDMLLRRNHVVLVDGGGEVTRSGEKFLAELGVDLPKARRATTAAAASTGPSAVITSRAPWALAWPTRSSRGAWSRACPTAAPSPSRRSAARRSPPWEWRTPARARATPPAPASRAARAFALSSNPRSHGVASARPTPGVESRCREGRRMNMSGQPDYGF